MKFFRFLNIAVLMISFLIVICFLFDVSALSFYIFHCRVFFQQNFVSFVVQWCFAPQGHISQLNHIPTKIQINLIKTTSIILFSFIFKCLQKWKQCGSNIQFSLEVITYLFALTFFSVKCTTQKSAPQTIHILNNIFFPHNLLFTVPSWRQIISPFVMLLMAMEGEILTGQKNPNYVLTVWDPMLSVWCCSGLFFIPNCH